MKKFRVFMLAALSILLLSSIVACGTTKVSGEEKTYSNAAKTFSIQLPAEDKGSWKVNKDATDDVLDLSDEKDTINIQVQCLPKNSRKPRSILLISLQKPMPRASPLKTGIIR